MNSASSSKAKHAARVLGNMTIVDAGEVRAHLLPALAQIEGPTTLGFLNAHGVNLSWSDAGIAASFAGLDFLLRDGIGVDICCQRLGWKSGANLNGTDFIPMLLDHCRGSVALLGTQSPWLDEAARKIADQGHEVVLTHHGFEETEFYVSKVLEARPDIVVLAMGMPKQEKIALAIKQAADWPVLIVCGGAILDWIAERFARAPEFFRRNHLEWAYRLYKEPRRLFRRYVIGNPLLLSRLPAIGKAVRTANIAPKNIAQG